MLFRSAVLTLLLLISSALMVVAQDSVDDESPDFIVEASVSNNTPYVGEQIVYTLRYYAYVLPEGVRDELPDFDGFWLSDVFFVSADSRIQTLNGRQYYVGEVYAEVAPLQSGPIIIDPAVLVVPETVFRDELRLETSLLEIEVQPLPSDMPDEFNGAVGQYTADFRVDERTITLGQPVRLTIEVSGTGNMEQLPAPKLPDLSGWRVYPGPVRSTSSIVSGLRIGEKVFQWMLIPEQVGTQTLPVFVFSYFDPQIASYRSLSSPSFTVDVFPTADNLRALPPIERERSGVRTAALPLKSIASDDNGDAGMPDAAFWLLWLGPPVLLALCAGWKFQHDRRASLRERSRRQRALRQALKRLDSVNKLPARKGHERIIEIIRAYVADKANMSIEDVKQQGVAHILNAHCVDEAIQSRLDDCLNRAQAGTYAPEGWQQDIGPLAKDTEILLRDMDKVWPPAL